MKCYLAQGRIVDSQYSRGRYCKPSKETNTRILYIKLIVSEQTATYQSTKDFYKAVLCYGQVKNASSNLKCVSKFVELYGIRGAEMPHKTLNGYDFYGAILETQFSNAQSRTLNCL